MRILRCDVCKKEVPIDDALMVTIHLGVRATPLEVCSAECVGGAVDMSRDSLIAAARQVFEERARAKETVAAAASRK